MSVQIVLIRESTNRELSRYPAVESSHNIICFVYTVTGNLTLITTNQVWHQSDYVY